MKTAAELHEMAVDLGRRGGKKGGRARADNMTAEERSESARKAAMARWGPEATPELDGELLDHLLRLLAERGSLEKGCPKCDVLLRRVRELRRRAADQMRERTVEGHDAF